MPKKAGDFAFSGTERFELKQIEEEKKKAAEAKDAMFFDIGKSSEKVRLVRQRVYTKLTGNVFLDNWNKLNDYLVDHSPIKTRDIATFFRLLAIMLNAGVPLIKSLDTLAIQSEKSPKLKKVVFDLARGVEQGKSLSEGMLTYQDVFSEAQLGMVQSGEVTGQLNMILLDLAKEAEGSARLTSKVKGAMIYPIVLLSIMAIVIVVMMVMVLPQMAELFSTTGAELPLITRVLMNASDFIVKNGLTMITVILGVIVGLVAVTRTPKGRYVWHTIKLNIPIFGNIIKKTALARFASSLGNLLGSGVSIVQSLNIVSKAIGNDVYKRLLMFAAEDLKKGIPLAENLRESKYFSKMLVNMIEVGEQTAQLETVTKKIADYYEDEVDTQVGALTKIMEPLLITVVGIMVGGLVAAIMLPIMQLTDVAGNV